MMAALDEFLWPTIEQACAILGIDKLRVVHAPDEQLRRQPRGSCVASLSDRYWALEAVDGKLDVLSPIQGETKFTRPMLLGDCAFSTTYDPAEVSRSSDPGRQNVQLQRVVGEIRADRVLDLAVGGAGCLITDEAVLAIKGRHYARAVLRTMEEWHAGAGNAVCISMTSA
ncbi:hypothetical protein WJX72_004483 [[Myrmecia] bisecta]|uniref:Uncharacterized protein n=1 Tax=[Myrmecia] bisecta TaxID=41462 RepID=A0AAW1PSY0_9CHLO